MLDSSSQLRSSALSRRCMLTTAGGAISTILAGCNKSSTSEPDAADETETSPESASSTPAGTATDTGAGNLTLESGSIATHAVPSIAKIIPAVDPLIVSINSSSASGVDFKEAPSPPAQDTLRYNMMAGGWPGYAMGNYFVSTEEGKFVSQIWLGILKTDVEVDRAAVVADVGMWYSTDITVQMMRKILADVQMSYETVVDKPKQLIVRAPNGDVVGFAPNTASFVPASQGSFPFSPVDRVTAVVETAAGARPPLHERDANFKRVLRHAPLDGVSHIAYSQARPLGEVLPELRKRESPGFGMAGYATGVENARAVVSEARLNSENDAVPARATVSYSDTSAITESALISNVGNHGVDRSYVRDETEVQVDCRYSWKELKPVIKKGI